MTHLSIEELACERPEMLPAREALGLFNFANVFANNSSTALNVLTANSAAVSSATQQIAVVQS